MRIVGTLEEIHGVPEYVEETKSSASRRMLTIPAFLAEMLGAHLQRGPGGAFVFTAKEGGLLRRSNFRRRYWKPALERAGLDTALRFHDYADPRVMPTSARNPLHDGVSVLAVSA